MAGSPSISIDFEGGWYVGPGKAAFKGRWGPTPRIPKTRAALDRAIRRRWIVRFGGAGSCDSAALDRAIRLRWIQVASFH
jgi:hypothetical protein